MADFKLNYTGAEVNETIKDGKLIDDIYSTLQSHLQGHVSRDARNITLGNFGRAFNSTNVEDALREMYDEYHKGMPAINEAFEQFSKQTVMTDAEIDSIISKALS